MSQDRLAPNPTFSPNTSNIHKADKEVFDLKFSSVSEKEKDVVTHIINFPRTDKETKVRTKTHQVYLKRNHTVLQTQVVEHFLINSSTRIILLLIKPKCHLMI